MKKIIYILIPVILLTISYHYSTLDELVVITKSFWSNLFLIFGIITLILTIVSFLFFKKLSIIKYIIITIMWFIAGMCIYAPFTGITAAFVVFLLLGVGIIAASVDVLQESNN